jgi:mRNA interferase MazF
VRQYEIRWADMPAPIGRRPVLLLSRTPAYGYLNKVIVAEVTTSVRGIAQEVRLGVEEGLDRASVANLDNVHVVAKTILGARLGSVAQDREREIKRALGHALGWYELQTL